MESIEIGRALCSDKPKWWKETPDFHVLVCLEGEGDSRNPYLCGA